MFQSRLVILWDVLHRGQLLPHDSVLLNIFVRIIMWVIYWPSQCLTLGSMMTVLSCYLGMLILWAWLWQCLEDFSIVKEVVLFEMKSPVC